MNKLSLNESKTKYMVFTQKKCSSITPSVSLNGSVLERVHTIKILAVVLNDRLDWKDHKIYIKTKISKTLVLLIDAEKF